MASAFQPSAFQASAFQIDEVVVRRRGDDAVRRRYPIIYQIQYEDEPEQPAPKPRRVKRPQPVVHEPPFVPIELPAHVFADFAPDPQQLAMLAALEAQVVHAQAIQRAEMQRLAMQAADEEEIELLLMTAA